MGFCSELTRLGHQTPPLGVAKLNTLVVGRYEAIRVIIEVNVYLLRPMLLIMCAGLRVESVIDNP